MNERHQTRKHVNRSVTHGYLDGGSSAVGQLKFSPAGAPGWTHSAATGWLEAPGRGGRPAPPRPPPAGHPQIGCRDGGNKGPGVGRMCVHAAAFTECSQLRRPSHVSPQPSNAADAHLSGSSVRPHSPSDQASMRGKSSGFIACSWAAVLCSSPCTAAGLPAPPAGQAASQAASAASRKAGCRRCCSAASASLPLPLLSTADEALLSQVASTCAQASCTSRTNEKRPSCCAASLQHNSGQRMTGC